MEYLEKLIPEKDSLKIVKSEAAKFHKTHSSDECCKMGRELYQSDNFQIQEVGVLLLGYASHENAEALSFLKNTVSLHESWKVQEVLAMAFDNHCRLSGYREGRNDDYEYFYRVHECARKSLFQLHITHLNSPFRPCGTACSPRTVSQAR